MPNPCCCADEITERGASLALPHRRWEVEGGECAVAQPVRYAVEPAEHNGTSLGREYYARASWSGEGRWDSGISLTKQTYTIADLLNTFSRAGLWVEETAEPELPEAARRRFPHKAAWMDKHLGILIFKLRPLSVR